MRSCCVGRQIPWVIAVVWALACLAACGSAVVPVGDEALPTSAPTPVAGSQGLTGEMPAPSDVATPAPGPTEAGVPGEPEPVPAAPDTLLTGGEAENATALPSADPGLRLGVAKTGTLARLIELVRPDLAQRLGADPAAVSVVEVREVEFLTRDLDCTLPRGVREPAARPATAGYEIVLAAGDRQYMYHALGSKFVFCGRWP